MPIQSCQLNGKPGYKWGEQGKCYTYTPGNSESQARARASAMAQAQAILASQGKVKDKSTKRY